MNRAPASDADVVDGASIVWRDEAVVVVNKAPGCLVHNSAWAGPKERTLTDMVRDATGLAAVPLHRLDRGTSGLVAFAVDRDVAAVAAARLGVAKAYLAIVRGHTRAAVDVDHPLDDDDVKGSERREAKSRVIPVAASPIERVGLVAVVLWTGRRHQARRHCKHISHPIIGDATHGKGPINRDLAARRGLTRLCLHAWRLRVDDVVVEAPVPSDWHDPIMTLWPALHDVRRVAHAACVADDGAVSSGLFP